MSTSIRTLSLLAAAAATVGIAVAAPAAAAPGDENPPDPVRPTQPLESHARAVRNLTAHLPSQANPPEPVRTLTENFDRFADRFGEANPPDPVRGEDPPEPVRGGDPADPVLLLPAQPFASHARAVDNLIAHFPDQTNPPEPVRRLTENFDRFNERFGDGSVTPPPPQ